MGSNDLTTPAPEPAAPAPEPMTSRQKILALVARLDEVEPGEVSPQLQALLLTATLARPQLVGALPENAETIDGYLLLGAHFFLQLRSDQAPAYHVVDEHGAALGDVAGGVPE